MSAQSEILAYLIERSQTVGKQAVAGAIKEFRRLRSPGTEPTKRKHISKGLRFQIYKRQRGECAECGLAIAILHMEIDHYQPVVSGGSHSVKNFRLLCQKCNREKAAHDPIEHSKRQGKTILESMPRIDGEFAKLE